MIQFIVTFVGSVVSFWVGVWMANRSHAAERRLQLRDERILRDALAEWATAYNEAKPTGKYLKRREKLLFDACTRVGLMWIPTNGPVKP